MDLGGAAAQNSMSMALDGVGSLDAWLKPALGGLKMPFAQKRLGLFGRLLPELLKVQSHGIGPGGF